jgi:hypothetical protein
VVNSGYSDVTLGLYLRYLNISILNSDLFKGQAPDFYGYDYESINNYVTFHYIKTMEGMNKLLEKIKK